MRQITPILLICICPVCCDNETIKDILIGGNRNEKGKNGWNKHPS